MNEHLKIAKQVSQVPIDDDGDITTWFPELARIQASIAIAVELQNTNKLLGQMAEHLRLAVDITEYIISGKLEGIQYPETNKLIETLGLSGRVYHALRTAGVITVADALKVARNEKRIITRGYGKKARTELTEKLHQKGYLNG